MYDTKPNTAGTEIRSHEKVEINGWPVKTAQMNSTHAHTDTSRTSADPSGQLKRENRIDNRQVTSIRTS